MVHLCNALFHRIPGSYVQKQIVLHQVCRLTKTKFTLYLVTVQSTIVFCGISIRYSMHQLTNLNFFFFLWHDNPYFFNKTCTLIYSLSCTLYSFVHLFVVSVVRVTMCLMIGCVCVWGGGCPLVFRVILASVLGLLFGGFVLALLYSKFLVRSVG